MSEVIGRKKFLGKYDFPKTTVQPGDFNFTVVVVHEYVLHKETKAQKEAEFAKKRQTFPPTGTDGMGTPLIPKVMVYTTACELI